MSPHSKGMLYFIPVAVPGLLYFFIPEPVRHRFLFEIFRQIIIVIPVIFLVVKGFSAKWGFPIDRFHINSAVKSSIAIYAISFILLLTISATVFRFFPVEMEDEDEYVFTARLLASGRLTAKEPPCPEYFLSANYVMSAGKWYGIHPPGHPLLLVLPALLGHIRGLAPLLWAGTAVLGFFLFRKSFTLSYALLGAGLLIFSPMFIVMSCTLLSENSSLLVYTGFLLCFMHLETSRKHGCIPILFAVLFCLGLYTRPLSFLAASIPFVAGFLITIRDHKRSAVLFCAMCTACFAVICLANISITGSGITLPLSQYQGMDGLGFIRGFTITQSVTNVALNLVTLGLWYFGNPVIFIIPLYFIVTGLKNRIDMLFIMAFILLVLSSMLYWHPGSLHTLPRRFYEGLVICNFLTLRGVQTFIRRSGESPDESERRSNTVAWFVVILLWMNITTFLPGRLAVFHKFAAEAVKPLSVIPETLNNESIILVSKEHWKFGYPRNHPDISPGNGPFFVSDPGAGQTGKLEGCFPDYAMYRLTFSTGTTTWNLEKLRPKESGTNDER